MAATPLPADISVENHESVLGRWRVARWTPPQLAGLVDHMWYFQGEMVRRRERIFPDGRLELIVHFGPVYREAAGAGGVAFPASGMVGQLLRSTVIEAPAAPCEVLGVRLHVAGAYALLRRPMNEMAGLTVDLRDVMGSAAAELVDRCGAETTARGRLGRAAEWLAARMLPDAVDPAVAWATAEIERRHGAVSIGALQQRTGWSRTRFHATFRRQIGVPPKVFARVVRFRRALMMVGADAAPLARIAQDAGYYDQAHFNAEFRELAGVTPGEFRAATRYPDSINVADDG